MSRKAIARDERYFQKQATQVAVLLIEGGGDWSGEARWTDKSVRITVKVDRVQAVAFDNSEVGQLRCIDDDLVRRGDGYLAMNFSCGKIHQRKSNKRWKPLVRFELTTASKRLIFIGTPVMMDWTSAAVDSSDAVLFPAFGFVTIQIRYVEFSLSDRSEEKRHG